MRRDGRLLYVPLLQAYKGMKRGGVLRVINTNQITKEVFKVVGFDSLFSIE